MKKIIKTILALVAMFTTQFSLSAMSVDGETFETVSEKPFYESSESVELPSTVDMIPPLYSKGAIKKYALKNVTRGFMWVDVKNGENFFRYFYGDTPQQIVDQMMEYEIEIKSLRPEQEEIDIYVSLQGGNDATYFSGNDRGIALEEYSNGNWSFKTPSIVLVMQEHIMIPIPEAPGDVDKVEIRIRDDYGYIVDTIDLGHYVGRFYFPTRIAGEFGEIVFIDTKGQEFSYDLQSGKKLTKESFVIDPVVSIDNYKEFNLSGGTKEDFWPTSVYTDDGTKRTAPTYYLKVTDTTTFVVSSYLYESIKGIPDQVQVHYPQRAWLEKVGDDFEEEVIYRNGLKVGLEPGEYYLQLEYEILEESGYNAPNGKG